MPTVAEIYNALDYGPAPESAEPALRWLHERGGRLGQFVGGKWSPFREASSFETVNPATGSPLARVTQASGEDVEAAIHAAREAQAGWWDIGPHARARYLYALARQVQKHARLLAVLETLDNGKPIRETRDIDIPLVARHFYHHAGWAQLMPSELPDCDPVGVIGQIIPWNFPLLMLAWKVAPALAMGNTVVLKPAEFTPLTALAFAELCDHVGLPPGVVNIVTGDGAVGQMLVGHAEVDKIAFTGSTEVGRLIRRQTAGAGKRLSLELGGKSPFLVFEDADLDGVVEGVVDAIWFNQGQVCCAGSRLLMQESVADRLIGRLKARMETLRVGDPMDKCTDIGAIIAPVQLEKIQRIVEEGRAEGAEVWQPVWDCPREGCFYPPTLVTGVSPAASIAQEEIFGPVITAMTFRTPAEAVELANNTRYGLAASVWTENINLALDVAPKIKAGTVWINSTNLFDAAAGFGGYRESGFGREGGREGLWEYVRPRRETVRRIPNTQHPTPDTQFPAPNTQDPPLDRTPKLYIRGKQVRPDSGYSAPVTAADGGRLGEVGEGNRKDIRNAVEAARAAQPKWQAAGAHLRAQVLYYLAENLEARAEEFAGRIAAMTGAVHADASREVSEAVECVFTWAALADKHDGAVHHVPMRGVTLAMNEPMGVVGIVCPEALPLLGLLARVLPAVATGSAVVVVPSRRHPLAATDLYQVLETSDMPPGVFNIVTGPEQALAETLAHHDDVQSVWHFGSPELAAVVERASAGNMKRAWCDYDERSERDLLSPAAIQEFLREATQVKNVWVPYGEGIPSA